MGNRQWLLCFSVDLEGFYEVLLFDWLPWNKRMTNLDKYANFILASRRTSLFDGCAKLNKLSPKSKPIPKSHSMSMFKENWTLSWNNSIIMNSWASLYRLQVYFFSVITFRTYIFSSRAFTLLTGLSIIRISDCDRMRGRGEQRAGQETN